MVLDCVVCSVPFAGFFVEQGFYMKCNFCIQADCRMYRCSEIIYERGEIAKDCTRCCVCVIQMRWCGEVPWWRSSFDGALVVDVRGV